MVSARCGSRRRLTAPEILELAGDVGDAVVEHRDGDAARLRHDRPAASEYPRVSSQKRSPLPFTCTPPAVTIAQVIRMPCGCATLP